MKLVLVTGMSGAGKSVALNTLEDSGYEAIDNIPLSYVPAMLSSNENKNDLALVIDIRNRDFCINEFLKTIQSLSKHEELECSLLFLDCNDEVLCRRFTETRRRHPMAVDRSVMDGLRAERELIEQLRDHANHVIDSSDYSAADLRDIVNGFYASDDNSLHVALTSFSFKRGVPREADMVFDVRFLKNPFYDAECKPLDGRDPKVGEYIESDSDFSCFYERLTALLSPLLPRYHQEGKKYLTIAVGCTGGRHRSVYVVQKLFAFMEQHQYNTTIRHRDVE